jgi:hypothetical protein
MYMRYASGIFAPVYSGKKVTPDYRPEIHRHKNILEPAKGLVGFRWWDGWTNPVCLMGQVTKANRLIFLDTIIGENTDVGALIDNQVIPMMNSPRWKDKCYAWRDGGDYSMATPDQSNKAQSAAKVVEKKLKTRFERGPSSWSIMKIQLHQCFNRSVAGMPAVQINPGEYELHKALEGRWHYKVDNSGNITSDIPEKNMASHIGDAFANGVNIFFGRVQVEDNRDRLKDIQEKLRQRASSYSGGGVTYAQT